MEEPDRYPLPELGRACVDRLFYEIDRLLFNRHGKDVSAQGEDLYAPAIMEMFPGMTYQGFWWGDDNHPDADLPNFSYEGLRIWWYKHRNRGMETDNLWTPQDWEDWLCRSLDALSRIEAAQHASCHFVPSELCHRP